MHVTQQCDGCSWMARCINKDAITLLCTSFSALHFIVARPKGANMFAGIAIPFVQIDAIEEG